MVVFLVGEVLKWRDMLYNSFLIKSAKTIATNQQEQKGVEMKRSMKNDEPEKQKRMMLKRKEQCLQNVLNGFAPGSQLQIKPEHRTI